MTGKDRRRGGEDVQVDRFWMIVDRGVGAGSGYARRVQFELEILNGYFGTPVVIHPKDSSLPPTIQKLCIPQPVELRRPMALQSVAMEHFLEQLIKRLGKPRAIYGQNLVATFLASRFSQVHRIPLVFDYHGVVPAEAQLIRKGLLGVIQSRLYTVLEHLVLRRANLIITVSDRLLDFIRLRASEASRCVTLPMLPSADLFTSPAKQPQVASEDNVVFAYLGQAQPWQMVRETLQLYSRIEKENKNAFLLVLSRDIDIFQTHARELGLSRYKILTARHDEVPGYLRQCDYGFVLREPSTVNKVASPTKVLEYLACGTMPIITEHVGDFSETLPQNQMAICIPYCDVIRCNTEQLSVLTKQSPGFRARAAEYVRTYRQRYVSDYVAALADL